jgi:hypothetical protein
MPFWVRRNYRTISLLRSGIVGMRILIGEGDDIVVGVTDRRGFALESY